MHGLAVQTAKVRDIGLNGYKRVPEEQTHRWEDSLNDSESLHYPMLPKGQ